MHRDLLTQLNWGAVEINLNATIQWVNPCFEKMTGFSLRELKGKNAVKMFLNSTVEKQQASYQLKARKKNENTVFEARIRKKDGNLIDLVINGTPVTNKGIVSGSIALCWDITNIKNAHRKTEQSILEIRKDFIRENMLMQEKQRASFSRQLHDGVGQTLAYTSLFLQKSAINDKHDQSLYIKAQGKVSEALNEVRSISRSLMPHSLNELGLKEAIIELLNQYSDIKKTFFVLSCNTENFKNIEFNAQRNIYRILEELTKNASKHSKASNVHVKFTRTKASLKFTFKDNGVGLKNKKINKGLGLKNIRNMVELYDGKLEIETDINKGSCFAINLPLEKLVELT